MSDWRDAATRALTERIDAEHEFDNVDDDEGEGDIPDLEGGLDGGMRHDPGYSGAGGDPRSLANAVKQSYTRSPDIYGVVRGGLR